MRSSWWRCRCRRRRRRRRRIIIIIISVDNCHRAIRSVIASVMHMVRKFVCTSSWLRMCPCSY